MKAIDFLNEIETGRKVLGGKVFFSEDIIPAMEKYHQSKEKEVLMDYLDWYKKKYGGLEMISEFWIDEFIKGY